MKLLGLFATLAAAQSTPNSSNKNDSPTPMPTPTPMPGSLPKFEIDIIHPRNTTYNLTSHLPIVFAFQNFDALTSLRGLSFIWVIQHFDWPFYRGGEDFKQYDLDQDSLKPEFQKLVVPGSPYILVESSKTDKWQDKPQEWEEQEGKLYSLTCFYQALPRDQGNACGVKLDPAKLQSISFEAAVKATATPSSSTGLTPTPTPTKNSAALAVVEPALLGIMGSMSILFLS
ncbi:hypothetical protein DM02DRAFT_180641 [Periconia macrospinosa]|uniref:DUF7136 domain-containing protein n=1 Tax=Periconia macrospinosa TaxID=97972 RepID=A0A2V1D9J2_9PLEO|nr:hypothetical protein DM02DRAFT_180641 [Periconia macrospinosa]